jgi:uncharacterized protein (TIGR02147 family)
MISIYQYLDYRLFLREYYARRKQQDSKYSHRYFADKAGISSTGFFSDVLTGKRNLTPSLILKFGKALKLSAREQEYFENLVQYNQATTLEGKNYHYGKMSSFRTVTLEVLNKYQYEFYRKWYYSAIREVLCLYRFKDDYAGLAKQLSPSIRPAQAQRAIKLLEKLGLIKKDAEGYYQQTTAIITTGKEFSSLHVSNFQLTTLDLAKEALDRFPREQRDFSTLTVGFSQKTMEEAKTEIASLRKRLLAMAENEHNPDRVCQINFQMHPLSRVDTH